MPFLAQLSTFIRPAPRSVAATGAMNTLSVRLTFHQKQIGGASTMQAHQFAKTSKAEASFVTLSTLTPRVTASWRLVPQPLGQRAALLDAGSKDRSPFIGFLKGPETHAEITRHGCAWQAWS